MSCRPTGGGKSVCFQVPALLFERLTVVVSPLISLMSDQVAALEKKGIAATFLNSTLSPDEAAARVARIRSGNVRLLYLAPERLTTGATSSLLGAVGVDLLAIDEAHCVSEWGQDFRPSYLRLAELRRLIGDPQAIAFTATATPRVRGDIARLLALRNPITVIGGFDRPNLSFHVHNVKGHPDRNAATVEQLRGSPDPSVVYAATRRQVDQVVRLLTSSRVPAVGYHAGMSADRRARTQSAFMSGATRVMVATNAFGMGIDKPDVRLVLHYMHSGSLEDYYQEAGRAGRDGATARCVLLFHASDRGVHDRMRQSSHVEPGLLRAVWEHLSAGSLGRRAVPVDPVRIAARLGRSQDPGRVSVAIRLLQERGALPAPTPVDRVRVRLLASPLRLACERGQLSRDANALLGHIIAAQDPGQLWVSLDARSLGMSQFAFDVASTELVAGQLALVEQPVARLVVAAGPAAKRGVDRVIRELERRHEVDRAKLASMVCYAMARTCRRRFILSYFGERLPGTEPCGRCDVCSPRS